MGPIILGLISCSCDRSRLNGRLCNPNCTRILIFCLDNKALVASHWVWYCPSGIQPPNPSLRKMSTAIVSARLGNRIQWNGKPLSSRHEHWSRRCLPCKIRLNDAWLWKRISYDCAKRILTLFAQSQPRTWSFDPSQLKCGRPGRQHWPSPWNSFFVSRLASGH